MELIAELRWGSGGTLPAGQPQGAGQVLLALSGQHEEFFMRFAKRAGAVGYDSFERVIPHGFLAPPFQVVYRFRQKEQQKGTTLYQVGAGVFSANSTPPYRFWADFRPVLEQGVRLLLETRNLPEKQMPFMGASLRYINGFGSKFTQGRSTAASYGMFWGLQSTRLHLSAMRSHQMRRRSHPSNSRFRSSPDSK